MEEMENQTNTIREYQAYNTQLIGTVLSLVCSRLDFCTKDVVTKKVGINHIVNAWKYRYGKGFYSCVIWIELDTCSTTLENYLNGFRPKEEDYKIVKPKSKIIYGKFLGNVGMGKVSSPPKSSVY